MPELLWPGNENRGLSFKSSPQLAGLFFFFFCGWKRPEGFWYVFKSQFSNIIMIIPQKRMLSALKGSRADKRSTSGPSLFTRLLLAKLHHGNCLLFTLIYLDCDNQGLTDSWGYDVIEDLGIDFWFTRTRPVCFWMRHAGVDLKKLLDLGILATAGKWSSNCVKGGDRQVCHKYSFTLPCPQRNTELLFLSGLKIMFQMQNIKYSACKYLSTSTRMNTLLVMASAA